MQCSQNQCECIGGKYVEDSNQGTNALSCRCKFLIIVKVFITIVVLLFELSI